ncbi:Mediator of RNA polymerase II transcription subunit 27 [Varanus komodoensis]|nr:Mediator of RNA polymerase II transcription subunit 27 [Varanus komodoensis]
MHSPCPSPCTGYHTSVEPGVTLGKVLKVIVVMRSLFIDRTIVKGFHENVYTEDGKLDIWSKSNYQVFQKASNRSRNYCPAALPAAADAGCGGEVLHAQLLRIGYPQYVKYLLGAEQCKVIHTTVNSLVTWLRSYIKLFQAPCQRCGKFLQDGLPPTWRDFRTLEAFHDTCRQ